MIQVTRLDDSKLLLNVEKIQSLRSVPDTVITFTNESRMMVKEPIEQISRMIQDYQRSLAHELAVAGGPVHLLAH